MGFFVLLLTIGVIILFVIVFDAKKEIGFLKTILQRHREENDSLKSEMELIRKLIKEEKSTSATILPQAIAAPVTEINEDAKPVENEIMPGEIFAEETAPYFIPIPDADLKPEEIVNAPETASPLFVPANEPISDHIEEPLAELDRLDQEDPKTEKIHEESAFSVFIKKTEKQFADNWTGILGTAIMVLGIGYLSIYTALKVSPFYRILILWAYAGMLMGSYYLLKKKEKWEKTGLWLRSAGASLFLFGCFGASQIAALKFVTNDVLGYSLIGLGIGLNLFIGYIIRQQAFLSLHVILSMLVLCVVPDKILATFLLAAATGVIGIVLSYKEKWEYHLLVVIFAFIVFDIWFNYQGTNLTQLENIFAITGIIAVAVSCMFMQYRSVYENTRFDKAAFITHLANWILFATGLVLHSTGSRFKAFVLFGGAIACFLMTLKARRKNVFWLYHLDGMVSFVLCALSIVMLQDWNIGIDIIGCAIYLLIIACLFVIYREKEHLLHKIFLYINHVAVFVLAVIYAVLSTNSFLINTTSLLISNSCLAIIAFAVPVYSNIRKEFLKVDNAFGAEYLSLNGLFSIVAFLFLFSRCNDLLIGNYFYYVMIGTALLWCFTKSKFNAKTFDLGRIFFLSLSIIVGAILIHTQPKSLSDWAFAMAMTIVIFYNWSEKRFYQDDFIIRFISIVGMNVLLSFMAYKYLSGHHTAFVFALLAIALLNHEFLWMCFKRKLLNEENQMTLFGFYYFFAIAASLSLLLNIYSLSTVETGLACLGISVVEIYVLTAKRFRSPSDETITGWTNFHFLNSELLVFNALVFGFSCLQIEFAAIYFALTAVIALIAFEKLPEFKRYSIYSFALLMLCIGLTLYSAIDNIDSTGKTMLYISQFSSILISALYVYFQSKSDDKRTQEFYVTLPYVQNFWIVALLFLQVQLCYLPLIFMALALVNYWLIVTDKIKIKFHFAPLVALLAILVSCIYSIGQLNSFGFADWGLQLASVFAGLGLVVLLNKKETSDPLKSSYQIVLNIWLSVIMFSQLPHKWLPIYWAAIAIVNLFLYHKKISREKHISIVYYFLANLHLGFLSFNFYESEFLLVYMAIFLLLAIYIYLAYKWLEEFSIRNSLLIYPATLSIGCFLYLTFDKGILTFFWILEALGLLILGILLKEKYFRYVSLSLVGLCIIRLMFFDLSNTDFLIRALVLLGVGVVLIVMNSLFKKYKDRFD
ncbi:MAG: hypothetical protein QM710_06270 [Flavobacterium sp.]